MNLTRWEPFKEADDFFRSFSPGIKREDVKVALEDGVLNVHIPRIKVEKPKAVEIKVQ